MSPKKAAKAKKEPELLEGVKAQRSEVETCFGTSCNMCERDCPVYRARRNRTLTSRGKNRALLGALKGHYPMGSEFAKAVYTCTICGLCDARCALKNTERFVEVRRQLTALKLTTPDQDKTVDTIKKTGDVYGRNLDVTELFKEYANGDMPVFIGCTYKGYENEAREALKVLELFGVKPKVGKEICCGNVIALMGYGEDFKEVQEAFKKAWPYKEFLTLCPSCAHVFNKYYGLKAKHVIEYVAEHMDKVKDKIKPLNIKATYHDPCDLGRRLQVFDQPRKVLTAIGVDLVEMELNREFSHCCGAGGGLLVYDKELAEDIGKNRIKMASKTGAEILVTACPTCETQLTTTSMLVRKELPKRVKVVSIWSLLLKALS